MNPMTWHFPYPSRRMPVMAESVVATSQPLAAQAGLCMLLAGGNAVDAAIAAAAALTVVEPTSNGLGGDAFALVWDTHDLHGLNGSGRSPAAWTPDRFNSLREMPAVGWDTVTVPGAVDLWVRLWERFGRLPFENLLVPAVRYAREGFPVSPVTAAAWAAAAPTYAHLPGFVRIFLPGGRPPEPGQWFTCPEMADTLIRIGRSRGKDFYRGTLAEKIAACAAADGGALTLSDLSAHQAEWTTPLHMDYHGIRLHEMPPNGQGMAALMALGILAHHELREYPPDSADSLHLQIEAMKLAFGTAHAHVGDPDGMTVAPRDLLDPAFLGKLAARIQRRRALDSSPAPSPDRGTVYLAAADRTGMMVSFIQSNYAGFGSGIVVPGTGISLHNRGRGFCLTPGHPNRVAGGKRPYHTIIPGFVTRNGAPLMSFGVMGAHMQPQGHVQMIVRIFDYGQNPQTASDAPRWQVLEDGTLALEKGISPGTAADLEARGHRITGGLPPFGFGGAQLILRLEKGYCAASDHRKDGCAVGF
ncbi:gamma-glutamyltransferase family protein [Desulfococcus multivorans]|uniref:Gamma-glutamyltranspeptidase n=1 Tax=Desulfococcus multivorans DSM 2059 TaxID=1121405 RepID=S7TGM7_DESML|nr:gamma-glutamyltransferase family protein [Desulfococcus multivorans]AQV03085.1 gamma-glutamyltransferase [Desulfococcus multivorans]EPR35936.1 gamma-glutamyltranspeptidase [Desulfococcus multivorans DSM 2059]SJZ35422.1 gamma-glutamyltransferase 2. Threonine peptidase. MEROPS family T03 [Desulfococcus multivorans DSM 2059]